MEFTGGGGIVGLDPGGGYIPPNPVGPTNTNLAYVNAVNQASLNPNTLYGPGGFGYQTNYYSGAGAAYGRATGYYGDTSGLPPGAVTPAQQAANNYQDTGAYADYNSLNPQQQSYYDAHVLKYGYAPSFNNPTLLSMGGGGGGGGPLEPAGPAPPAYSPGGSNTPTDPGEGAAVDFNNLNAQQQAYYTAHVSKYGTAPGAGNSTLTGMADAGGPSSGGGAFTQPATPFSPSGPTASDPTSGGGHPTDPQEGAAVDFNSLNPQQQAYYNAHVSKYGTAPGANNSTLSGMANASPPAEGGAPPPGSGGPGTSIQPGPFAPGGPTASDPYSGGGHPTDPGEGAALDPSTWNDAQKAYADGHVLKYGTLPGANNATMRGLADAPPMEEAPPNSPGGLVNAGGFSPTTTIGGGGGGFTHPTDPQEGAAVIYENLNPQQQAYYDAHVQKYGTAPGANNSTLSGMAGGGGAPAGSPIPGVGGPFQGATGDAGQSPGMGPGMGGFDPSGFRTDPGEGAAVDYNSLNPQQQAYFQAHYQKYGTAPGANNATLSGMADAAPTSGAGSGIDAINRAAGIDPSTGNEYPPGVDRTTGQPYGVPPPTPGEALPFSGNPVNTPFTGNPVNYDSLNQIQPGAGSFTPASPREQWLAEQRAPIATAIADNPELLMQIAARIRTEDTNSPEGQQAVFEAMLNNQIATSFDAKGNPVKGVDMLGPAYYPKSGAPLQAYQDNLKLMQNDPGQFGQMREIIAKVLQGSNVSQGAFGWSQGGSPQAASDLANANLVYTSPKTGADYNVFYRPTGSSFGPGYIAGQNYWLSQMPP